MSVVQALAHDVLDLRLNRVTVEETTGEEERRQTKTKTFDLAPTDEFWQQHKGRSAGQRTLGLGS